MNKVAIAFLTKDRVELSKQTVEPLRESMFGKFDLHWFDGSNDPEAVQFMLDKGQGDYFEHANVRGGADTAVAYALTDMLKSSANYTHIGLVENDVLLEPDWFDKTMALFDTPNLHVGAVSARAYEDRILIQRDGYAVMHNLGWGTQIMTREAAKLALKYMRSGWTNDNRILFARLSGIDTATYWAFGANEHNLVPDWGNDRILAAHGLASLALTPSPVEMIGQTPPLAQQGLVLAKAPVEKRRDDKAFKQYVEMTNAAHDRSINLRAPMDRQRPADGSEIIFAHFLKSLDQAQFSGDWVLKWSAGFGPFGWQAANKPPTPSGILFPLPQFECNISGPVRFLMTGGEKGGQVAVEDLKSGYVIRPTLPPDTTGQVMHVPAPCGVSWRKVQLTCMAPGVVFYGVQCQEPQPYVPFCFDHSVLPPVA